MGGNDPVFIVEAPPVAYWNSNPYALAFSPDGARLALGSGGWYGLGGVSVVEAGSLRAATLRFVTPDLADEAGSADDVDVAPGEWGRVSLTISGVAFDDTGEHLAACGWSGRHNGGPAFLFRSQGRELTLLDAFVAARGGAPLDGGPTGVCFDGRRLHVRRNARTIGDVLSSAELPVELGGELAHRAHARIIRIGNELITGGGGSLKLCGWSRKEGDYESFKATTGLVVGMPVRGIPAPGERITAVLARPGGGLVTGGLGGEIVGWERSDDGWRPLRWLRAPAPLKASVSGPWATYRPESVVGLCALEDGRFFSVNANGEVLAWRDDRIVRTFAPPRPGTARCIAVHPDTPRGPLLAVGFKVVDGERRGYVACWQLG